MQSYTPTIGLEVHAELKTRTKMFCGSRNAPHDSEPNTHICPVCMGHPGALPTINREAVRHVLMVGRALGGTLAAYTEFDRKHYFYPDIPKGYQISQYAYPLVTGGTLEDVAITRIHLEEDTARSMHDGEHGSIIDFNRAGVPLMELVTEPVIRTAEEAGRFARELQLLLRTLGVSDAHMERGEMRVEVNISLSKTEALGTKVEIKNLNSFKSVEAAIAYEVSRQTELLEAGKRIEQETRGWDEHAGKTVSQRKKESSHDYRYFPDPDLPKLNISEIPEFSASRLDEDMPEKPNEKRATFSNLGLSSNAIEILVSDMNMAAFYRAALDELHTLRQPTVEDQRRLANYITSDISGYLAQHPDTRLQDAIPKHFAKLIHLLAEGSISSRVAKDILPETVFGDADPEILADERGLLQRMDSASLAAVVEDVVREHRAVADEYRAGKEASLQFLIGQGMKMTRGAANPTVLKELLVEKLSQ